MGFTILGPATPCAEVVAAAPRHAGGHRPGRMLMACVTLALVVIFSPLATRPANAAFLIQLDVEAQLNSGGQPAGTFTFSAIADFDPFTTNDLNTVRRSFQHIEMTVGGQPFVVPNPSFYYTSGPSIVGEGTNGTMAIGADPVFTNLFGPGDDFNFELGGFFNSGEQELLQPGLLPGGVLKRGDVGELNRSIVVDGATVSASIVPLPGALPLFATGLAGFGWLVHRRRRAAAER